MFKRATGFFDVVAYTGSGSNTTQAHNLGVAPEFMIVKNRDIADEWAVYHKDIDVDSDSAPETDRIYMTTQAAGDNVSTWYDTAPTAATFGIGTHHDVNASSEKYIAYLFATVAGVSKVGGYTGTAASLDLDMGFAAGARFFLVRRWDATAQWYIFDTARGIIAGNDPYLRMNSSGAQVTSTDYVDPLASGLTLTAAGSTTINISGGKYIFLAIA
tara:strand:- start:48 stop:692 length:645 start_codon:yes stop_codon:yes gene_type:complete